MKMDRDGPRWTEMDRDGTGWNGMERDGVGNGTEWVGMGRGEM